MSKTNDIVSALDLLNEHPAFKDGQLDPETRRGLAEKVVEQAILRPKQDLEERKWRYSTPLAVALTGLITLLGTFVINFFEKEQDLSHLLTQSDFQTKIDDLTAAREQEMAQFSAQLEERSAESNAGRAARTEERQFQYRIVEQLLNSDVEEVDRARTLLFLSRAGVLNELQTDELEKMATATIISKGGDPNEIGIPALPDLTNRGIVRIVVGAEPNLPLTEIRDYHLSLGWSDVGMHYFIDLEGKVQLGRPIENTPAFAQSYNTGSVAIGLACTAWTNIKNRPEYGCQFTDLQKAAARALISEVRSVFDLDSSAVKLRSDLRGMSALAAPIFNQLLE